MQGCSSQGSAGALSSGARVHGGKGEGVRVAVWEVKMKEMVGPELCEDDSAGGMNLELRRR